MTTNESVTGAATTEASPARATTRKGTREIKAAPKTKPLSKVKHNGRPQSKQDHVLAMLRHKEGTTVSAVMKATGWQKHSVHGFLSGVVRKKLKLKLVSTKVADKRIYRIDNRTPPKSSRSRSKTRAA